MIVHSPLSALCCSEAAPAMPAALLTALYEYSPPFYIAVVFVCFVVTSGLLLGWFGVDVPILLQNSEEPSPSNSFAVRKQMVQVTNPFAVEIANPDVATLRTGVTLRLHCLEESTLTCYWGCSVQRVLEALRKHVFCYPIMTPATFEEALYSEYLHKDQYDVPKEMKEEILAELPGDIEVEDFGPVPRTRYPLIALLSLSHAEDRERYPIVSMLSVIHIPDKSYRLPCRIIYQYLLTPHGQYYDLKLYMSTNEPRAESAEAAGGSRDSGAADQELLQKLGLSEEEEEPQGDRGRDCVVCLNDTVNWVLLPCRHVCLCDGCVRRIQHCPICRHFVEETFPLRSQTPPTR